MNTETAKRRIRRARILCGLAAGFGLLMAVYTYMAVRPTGYRELEKRVEARVQSRQEGMKRAGRLAEPPAPRAENAALSPKPAAAPEPDNPTARHAVFRHVYFRPWQPRWLGANDQQQLFSLPPEFGADDLLNVYLADRQFSYSSLLVAAEDRIHDEAMEAHFAALEEYYQEFFAAGWWTEEAVQIQRNPPVPRWLLEIDLMLITVLYKAAAGDAAGSRAMLDDILNNTVFSPEVAADDAERLAPELAATFAHLLAWDVMSRAELLQLRGELAAAIPERTRQERFEDYCIRHLQATRRMLRDRTGVYDNSLLKLMFGGLPHSVLYPLMLPLAERAAEDYAVSLAAGDLDGIPGAASALQQYGALLSSFVPLQSYLRYEPTMLRRHRGVLQIHQDTYRQGDELFTQRRSLLLTMDYLAGGVALDWAADDLRIREEQIPGHTIALNSNCNNSLRHLLWNSRRKAGQFPSSWEDLAGLADDLRSEVTFGKMPDVTVLVVEALMPPVQSGWMWDQFLIRILQEKLSPEVALAEAEALAARRDLIAVPTIIPFPDVPTQEEFLWMLRLDPARVSVREHDGGDL